MRNTQSVMLIFMQNQRCTTNLEIERKLRQAVNTGFKSQWYAFLTAKQANSLS